MNFIELKTVDSTNEYAKRLADEGAPEGTVVIAEMQTAGKGRNGRSFLSPNTHGIYMSIILRPALKPEKAVRMTALAAVAVSKSIEKETGLKADIKWVNDVQINGKKTCGILTEGKIQSPEKFQWAVVGIGVNVGKQTFPKEINEIATSLGNETEIDSETIRIKLYHDIAEEFMRLMKETDSHSAYLEYAERNVLLNKEVSVFKITEEAGTLPEFTGVVVGVDEAYRLLVKKQTGETIAVDSGEVRVRRN